MPLRVMQPFNAASAADCIPAPAFISFLVLIYKRRCSQYWNVYAHISGHSKNIQ